MRGATSCKKGKREKGKCKKLEAIEDKKGINRKAGKSVLLNNFRII